MWWVNLDKEQCISENHIDYALLEEEQEGSSSSFPQTHLNQALKHSGYFFTILKADNLSWI